MAAKVALADARSAGVQLCHHESTGSVDRVDIIRRRPRSEDVIARMARQVSPCVHAEKPRGPAAASSLVSG